MKRQIEAEIDTLLRRVFGKGLDNLEDICQELSIELPEDSVAFSEQSQLESNDIVGEDLRYLPVKRMSYYPI